MNAKAKGTLLGFAIGDALGAPAAGIRESVFLASHGVLTGFSIYDSHPLLGHLCTGQYTENTQLLLQAAKDSIRASGYSMNLRVNSLRSWANAIRSRTYPARWPGPTTLLAAGRLGLDRTPRPVPSESIGASYRIVPLALAFPDRGMLSDAVASEISLTHGGNEPVASGTFLAELLRGILEGSSIRVSGELALRFTRGRLQQVESATLDAVTDVLQSSCSVEEMRVRYGTSALARETLPLALGIALRYEESFVDAVLAAANSFRPDWVEPNTPCRTVEEELNAVPGGNTDGIAAIVGSIVGCKLGLPIVPSQFSQLENAHEIARLSEQLIDLRTELQNRNG